MSIQQADATTTDLVIRRHQGLMAGIAIAALAFSAGYLWRFGQTGGGVSLLLGIVLGVVAVLHGIACAEARTPLLVADETGLRVRLGGDWTGIPWSHVERVEVDERGRVTDGHVAVFAIEGTGELADARWRTRLGAALNRWLYDASLVVPFGLTTTVTVDDVPATLQRLAAGRAPVVVGEDFLEPEPTVAITLSRSSDRQADDPLGGPVGTEPTAPTPAVGSTSPTGEPEESTPAQVDGPFRLVRRPRIPLIAGRDAPPSLPLAKVVAALRSHPARREEVTLPVRHEPVTDGTLALSSPQPDAATQPLPEIEHLRRQRDEARERNNQRDAQRDDERVDNRVENPGPVGNVGLIIDATTDLSARAMSKVRRAAPLATSAELLREQPAGPVEPPDHGTPLVIGPIVRKARERLALTVDELADRTRIRPYVIESIEVDDFEPCGGDFYARGHLRMLARVLGLDQESLLSVYDEMFASSPINPRAVFDAELATASTGMIRSGVSGANWGGLIAAVLVLVLIWGVARYFAESTALPGTDVKTTQNAAGLGSPGPGDKPKPAPDTGPSLATMRVAAVGGDSRVVVKNRRGAVVWRGVLHDGERHQSRGLAPLHVMAVDGGVIRLGTAGHKPAYIGEPGVRSRQAVPASPHR